MTSTSLMLPSARMLGTRKSERPAAPGGAPGVRDPGALEAALFRPQTGYYDDIVAEAAALLESLAINHPFVDGNKRIAFAAADVFLRINGWRLQRAQMQIRTRDVDFLPRLENLCGRTDGVS